MKVIELLGVYVFPVIIVAIPVYGWVKGVKVYEAFIRGAEEGLRVVFVTLPYLVAIFVALSCFRSSGAMSLLSRCLEAILAPLGFPPDVVPLLVTRPISGSGALAITAEIMKARGPDSPVGILASILQGSTDTTFYVVTLYLGSVGIKRGRHALVACLAGDLAGFCTGYLVWRVMFR
ncbi:MAG TPA: spore maturation protein [Firmicutes bacterium]|nr:spore maturation protein [Candidatus Fermentithermobacillaceae bacterium]